MKTCPKKPVARKRRSGYPEALDFLLGLRLHGTKLGLHNIRHLLELLGNPQQEIAFYHLGGTNGKGSTAAILQALLMTNHREVGLFTSPHLEDFRERIRINERPIAPAEVSSTLARIRPLIPEVARSPGCGHPTYFEVVTALACDYFRRKKVRTVVWEVGLGGRLDATNIVRPRIAAITNVTLDHRRYLGETLREIAREKAGIVKAGIPLVTGETRPATLKFLRSYCRKLEAPLLEAASLYRVTVKEGEKRGETVSISGPHRVYEDLDLPLRGEHQLRNALTAFAAWERGEGGRARKVPIERVRRALADLSWPGRFEVRDDFGPGLLILDGAHNPAGARALAETLKDYLAGRPLLLILGVLADKNTEAICRALVPLARKVVAVRPKSLRALPAASLAQVCRSAARGRVVPVTVRKDLETVLESCYNSPPFSGEGAVCVTGSLYLVGEARAILKRFSFEQF